MCERRACLALRSRSACGRIFSGSTCSMKRSRDALRAAAVNSWGGVLGKAGVSTDFAAESGFVWGKHDNTSSLTGCSYHLRHAWRVRSPLPGRSVRHQGITPIRLSAAEDGIAPSIFRPLMRLAPSGLSSPAQHTFAGASDASNCSHRLPRITARVGVGGGLRQVHLGTADYRRRLLLAPAICRSRGRRGGEPKQPDCAYDDASTMVSGAQFLSENGQSSASGTRSAVPNMRASASQRRTIRNR